MYERFTDRAKKVMELADREAARRNQPCISTEHILLGLVEEGTGIGATALKSFGIDSQRIQTETEKLTKSGPDRVTMGELPRTPRVTKVIGYASEEARELHHDHVGTEHLLLGLAREPEGIAAHVLMNLGLGSDKIRHEVLRLLDEQRPPEPPPEPEPQAPPAVARTTESPSSSAGRLAEAWLSIGVGLILLFLVPNTPRYLLSLAHLAQPPLPMMDGTPYTQSVLVLPDASVAAFAAALLFCGLVFLLVPRRGLLKLLLVLMAAAVLLNLVAIIVEWNNVSPIFPALAMAFGGYQCFFLIGELGIGRRTASG